jgi:quercetin dioxygenase-like cupin family protein
MSQNETFKAELERDGYAIKEVSWAPGTVNPSHSHDFDARLLCLEGGMSVEIDGATKVCRPGDTLEMTAGCQHAETVGSNGVTLLVGRR